jgi:hypothetical protein
MGTLRMGAEGTDMRSVKKRTVDQATLGGIRTRYLPNAKRRPKRLATALVLDSFQSTSF